MAKIAQRKLGKAAQALMNFSNCVYSGFDFKQAKGFLIKGYNSGVWSVDRRNTGVLGQVRAFFTGHVRTGDYLHFFSWIVKVGFLQFFKVPGKSNRVPFSLERYQANQMMSP